MRWNPIWWAGWIYGAITALFRHGQHHGFQKVCAREHALMVKMNPAAAQDGNSAQQNTRTGGLFLVLGAGEAPQGEPEETAPPRGKMN